MNHRGRRTRRLLNADLISGPIAIYMGTMKLEDDLHRLVLNELTRMRRAGAEIMSEANPGLVEYRVSTTI